MAAAVMRVMIERMVGSWIVALMPVCELALMGWDFCDVMGYVVVVCGGDEACSGIAAYI